MKQKKAKIISNTKIAQDTFELVIELDEIVKIQAGQFAMLSVGQQEGIILKRPLSIHDYKDNIVTFIYTTRGRGTLALSRQEQGEIEVILPLGKGFPKLEQDAKVVLLGGGMGVFPLYSICKCNPQARFYSYLGFRSLEQVCTVERFQKSSAHCVVATDDGSMGKQGFITDILACGLDKLKPDIILACGPVPMFVALKKIIGNIPAYISMEERMACGFGACLVCACATKNGYVRTCTEGPVFNIAEVEL